MNAGETPVAAQRPLNPLPSGACDCHIHISDGSGKFPILRRTHPPVHAPHSVRQQLLSATGLERCIGVQLMAYGSDNTALIEALRVSGGNMRGIAELTASATDEEMQALHDLGVRGLRFYIELPTTVPGIEKVEGVGFSDLAKLASRMQALGWVAEVSARCDTILANAAFLRSLRVPIVLEHMAGCEATRGVADPAVQGIIYLLSEGQFWAKLTVCAMSKRFPNYEDIRDLHDTFVSSAPRRLVWGSNWPHRPQGERTPRVEHLLDLFAEWVANDRALRQTILVDNPAALFGFAEPGK